MKAAPSCAACEGERARVREHLEGALQVLQTRGLPVTARRARLVSELRRYTDEGRFPINETSPDRAMPAFIDAHGTRCAMAFLIENHGGEDLVARVAANDNHGFVHSLAASSDLRAWLRAWDLSIDEAARIQPGYCWTAAHCTCKNSAGAQTVLEVVDGKITKIHGKPSDHKVGDPLDRGYRDRKQTNTFLVVPYFVQREKGRTERMYEWKMVDEDIVTCGVVDKGVIKEHAIRALLSADCTKTLESIDPKYTKDCRPFERHLRNYGPTMGMFTIAVSTALWLRRRRERA